jgi:hypothetical protein
MWRPRQQGQHESADGSDFIVLEDNPKSVPHFIDTRCAVHAERAIRIASDLRNFTRPVSDLANDFLE